MIRIPKEMSCAYMGPSVPPVERLALPAHIIFETHDCYGGIITNENQTNKDVIPSLNNLATGPVYFEGVYPGDVLEIKIEKIKCNSPGFSLCSKGEGFIGEDINDSFNRIFHFDDMVYFGNSIKLPIQPMIGVIGVAPKEISNNVIPGDHGGNMDTKLIKEGAILYLPVFHEGGLLGIGDLHAVMGDGEALYEGLECSGEVEVTVNVRKDLKIDIPFINVDNKLFSVATDVDIESSLKKALRKLIAFLLDHSDIDYYTAAYICNFYGDLQISQVVDPKKTSRMAIDLEILEKLDIKL